MRALQRKMGNKENDRMAYHTVVEYAHVKQLLDMASASPVDTSSFIALR
jgi:hypothetical protein